MRISEERQSGISLRILVMRAALLLLAVLWLLAFTGSAYCQTNMGTLVGSVRDSSGAAIPNAKLTVINSETGVTTSTVTTGVGSYQVPGLVPGSYRVRVEATGFQAQVRTGVLINVSQTSTANFSMQVGNAKQVVTVRATNVGIQTQTATVATSVTHQLVEHMPLTNTNTQGGERDVLDLQFLTPGTEGGTFEGTVAGGQQFGGEILLDGNNIDTVSGNSADVINEVPSIEAVQEFTVLSSGLPSEYGRTTNGIENFVTKSGTNQFHGSAYDIIRNTAFDANTWFNNFYSGENCVGVNDTPACKATYATPEDKKNDWGANLGGPVIIPGVYNGRNKTFFFYNWEEVLFTSGGLNVLTLPTAANRQGDFSQNLTTNVVVPNNPCDNNSPIYVGEIFNPATTHTISGVSCRQPFPNNMIPAADISKVAQNVLKYVPLPNLQGVANNFTSSSVNPVQANFNSIRVDHVFSSSDRIFLSYYTNDFNGYNGAVAFDTPASEATKQFFKTDDVNVGWDHIFSPTMDNSFNVGFWRFYNILNALGTLADQNWTQELGIPGLPGFSGMVFPPIYFAQGGYYNLGASGGNPGKYFSTQNRVSVNDQLSWQKGRHTLMFGFGTQSTLYTSYNNLSGGDYTFANAETAGISSSITESGNSVASFLLGQINSETGTLILYFPHYTQNYVNVYGQDDLKVSRSLTLNLGLRWDVDMPYHAAFDNSSMFDPTLANPGADGRMGALGFAGTGPGRLGIGDTWMPTTWTDFAPRIGFAWAPAMFHDKTAIRGSYDIIYGQMPNGIAGSDQTGFTSSATYTDTDSIGAFNGTPYNLDQGIPPLSTTINTNPSQLNGDPINAVNQGTKPAMVQQWNLQVQHQFAPDLVFTASYVGNHDTRLASNLLDINALPEKYWALGNELNQPVFGNPYGIGVPYPGFTGAIANALRPYPQYLDINSVDESVGMSRYEALWSSLQREFRDGVSLLFSYTWSKNISDAPYWAIGDNPTVQDPFDISSQTALAPLNVPQNLSLAYTYELPFGSGKRFLNGSNRILNELAGGWTVGGIQQYASGSPISFGCADTIPGTNNCVRWDHVGNQLLSDAEMSGNFNPATSNYFLNPGQTAAQVFIDPESVSLPKGEGYTLGHLSAYTPARGYQGIGTSGLMESFSIGKAFPIGEHAGLQMRLEVLNAFNRHEFETPDTNPTALSFGEVTASQIPPRQMQLTARIIF
jgi:hypothetical protein